MSSYLKEKQESIPETWELKELQEKAEAPFTSVALNCSPASLEGLLLFPSLLLFRLADEQVMVLSENRASEAQLIELLGL